MSGPHSTVLARLVDFFGGSLELMARREKELVCDVYYAVRDVVQANETTLRCPHDHVLARLIDFFGGSLEFMAQRERELVCDIYHVTRDVVQANETRLNQQEEVTKPMRDDLTPASAKRTTECVRVQLNCEGRLNVLVQKIAQVGLWGMAETHVEEEVMFTIVDDDCDEFKPMRAIAGLESSVRHATFTAREVVSCMSQLEDEVDEVVAMCEEALARVPCTDDEWTWLNTRAKRLMETASLVKEWIQSVKFAVETWCCPGDEDNEEDKLKPYGRRLPLWESRQGARIARDADVASVVAAKAMPQVVANGSTEAVLVEYAVGRFIVCALGVHITADSATDAVRHILATSKHVGRIGQLCDARRWGSTNPNDPRVEEAARIFEVEFTEAANDLLNGATVCSLVICGLLPWNEEVEMEELPPVSEEDIKTNLKWQSRVVWLHGVSMDSSCNATDQELKFKLRKLREDWKDERSKHKDLLSPFGGLLKWCGELLGRFNRV